MVQIGITLQTKAFYQSTMIFIPDFHCDNILNFDYMRIFVSKTYIFTKVKSKPRPPSKAWTRYFVD